MSGTFARAWRGAGLAAWLALASLPTLGTGPLAAQERLAQSSSARIVAFLNEPREPEFGEVFDLEVQVRVAPDVVAFLSDTMTDAASSVSAGPGTWTVTVGAADSLDVRATYPVMAFLPGGVELPFVELWTRPLRPGESATVRPSSELPDADRNAPDVEHAQLYLGGIFVMPPSEMIGDDAMLEPRPPADVLGGERSAWLVAALLLLAVAGGTVAWVVLAGRSARAGSPPPLELSPREEALRELDRIRELGWHTNGRVADFYRATTDVLRYYAERREPSRWRTALTSSELLDRLREHGGTEIEPLDATVWTAECVKFGGRRPDPGTAQADWSLVRDWIETDGPGT